MKSRRNYYRLLRVQPDASLEMIKCCYRTLMQKLQHHPDLGGDEWDARHINIAYAVLRDSIKRARYDQELFQRHNIETLSRGNLGPAPKTFRTISAPAGNQRNYYQLLQIQPDAELAVIEASYKLLKRNPDADRRLLDEAWKTLHSAVRRRRYDQQLKMLGHKVNATNTREKPEQDPYAKPAAATQRKSRPGQKEKSSFTHTGTSQQQRKQDTPYDSTFWQAENPQTSTINNQYKYDNQRCLFCQSSYSHNDYAHRHEYCDECNSPLPLSIERSAKLPRRSVARAKTQKPALIYSSWPSIPSRVSLSDLSPTGLSFINKRPLAIGQTIKIDAEEFKAVAELKYCKAIGPFSKIGVRFLTIQFSRQRGSFVSTSA